MVKVWTKEKWLTLGCEVEWASNRQNHGSTENGFHSYGTAGPQGRCQAVHLKVIKLNTLLCTSTWLNASQGFIYLFFTTWERWHKWPDVTEQGRAGFSPGLPDSRAHLPPSPESGISGCRRGCRWALLCGTGLWRTPAPMECLCTQMRGGVLHIFSKSVSGISSSRDYRTMFSQDRDWVKHKHLFSSGEQIWLLFLLFDLVNFIFN